MSNICVSSQEEKFIFVVDKYITHHRDSVNNNNFYRKLYVLFAGYHLKYFYSRAQYRNSCYHVDTGSCVKSTAPRSVSTARQRRRSSRATGGSPSLRNCR